MGASDPTRRALLGLTGLAAAGQLTACSTAGPGGRAASSSAASSLAGTSGSPGRTAAASSPSVPASPPVPASPSATASPAAGADITHGPRDAAAVALTFHGDGPVEIVRGVLRALAREQAHVTVLAIGRWLAAEPDVARMVRDAGHELGNHTWSHRTMPRLRAGDVRDEVDRGAAELVKLTGTPGRWFRPSGTPRSNPAIRAAAVAAGYGACLGYDVDPLDYTDPGPAAVTRALAATVRPGSIVSLHLGHPGTLTALPAVLAHLHDRGLAPVTASELLLNG
jgi:peptidoglycan/xylan/chitin deacetylase (PgdA/CDA1 family)